MTWSRSTGSSEVLARNPPEFRDQIFTAAEQQAATSTEELARRFAVKEATLKALGIGLVAGIHPTDIEVSADADGRCDVRLGGATASPRARASHPCQGVDRGGPRVGDRLDRAR